MAGSVKRDDAADVGSLRGLRVLDLTTNVSGPYAAQILADLGADVLKVERPGGGDDVRGWGPPFWGDSAESVTFSTLNRNKRSVQLDLTSPADRETFEGLVGRCDVLIENMRPGAFKALGYDVERLAELNSRLVYCAISGFGVTGPEAMRPAFDPLVQAFSGLMSITGERDRAPVRVPVSILDMGTSLWTVIGVLNALRLSETRDSLIRVDTSLLETSLAWQQIQLLGYVASGAVPRQIGSGTPGISPYQAFATADSYVVVAAANDRLWRLLCGAIGLPELADDARFRANSDRVRNRDELSEILTVAFAEYSSAELCELLSDRGVPNSPIRTIDQVLDCEQVKATELIRPVDHAGAAEYAIVQTPIRTDGRRFAFRNTAPDLNGDAAQVPSLLGTAARAATSGWSAL